MSNWTESMWASFLAGAALKSTAVLCAAWLLAFLLRSRSAAARHVVWTAAFAALLALPFLTISLPALRVPVGQTFLMPAVLFQTTATGAAAPAAGAATLRNSAVAVKTVAWRPDWRMFLMLLWAAGSLAAFIHMLLGWATLGRIRRTATPAGHPDHAVLEALGIRHQVNIVQTARGSMPMIFGLLRPAVFMPADSAEWSPERRRVVLLHELAHVRRGDLMTHLLARTALNLYWWNPLAWLAWREFLKERERATDDLVLNAGARASEYAGHLLEIARTMQSRPSTAWAAIAMARRSQLEGRMLSILDSHVNRNAPGRVSAFAAALLAVAIVAPLAAVHGQDKAAQTLPADVDATIRSAESQKNFDILDKTAKSAAALKQYDLARRLLDSALALRGQVAGPESLEYGTGLLHLGDLERKRGKKEAAESFYTQAASVLGNHPEAARALIYLGSTAIGRKAFDEAIEDFKKAQMVDPNQAPTATLMMAAARQRENKPEEADSLYKRAVAISDTNSETATALNLYAKFLNQQGRDEEAKSAADRALAFRKPISHPTSAGVSHIGGGVSAPSVAYKVEPEYTEEARAAQLAGTVILNVEISADGLIQGAWVVTGLGLGLDQKSIEAVEQWRFKPATKDGQPVPVAATIEVNWRLL